MSEKIFIAIPKIISKTVIEKMRLIASESGFVAVFSVDVIPKMEPTDSSETITIKTFNALCHAMKNCNAMVANVTSCLGVEPDADVIFQLGFMAAQRKPVFSFTHDTKPLYFRVQEWNGAEFTKQRGNDLRDTTSLLTYDRNMMRIENLGIKDHSKSIEHPGPDSYNDPMLEGPSLAIGHEVLTPKKLDIIISPDETYITLTVFSQAILDAKKHMLLSKKTLISFSTTIAENVNAVYFSGPGSLLPEHKQYFAMIKEIIKTKADDMVVVLPVEAQRSFNLMPEHVLANGNNPHLRQSIYEKNTLLMKSAHMGIFNLTPHRGVAPHSATIFEMGYMVGKENAKDRMPKVYGFSTSDENLVERIDRWFNGQKKRQYSTTSSDYIYHFGSSPVYSEMIDGAILASKGLLSHRPKKETGERRNLAGARKYLHLDEFTSCANAMASQFLKDVIANTPSLGARVSEGPNFWAPHTAAQKARNQDVLAQQKSPYC